jgi:hypothetical protein
MESDLACETAPAAADARASASHRHRSAIQPHTRQRIKRVVHSSNAQQNAAQHGRARTSIRIASCLEPASCSILPLRARACCITGRRRISSTVGRSFGCGVHKQQRDDEDTKTTVTTPQRRRRHDARVRARLQQAGVREQHYARLGSTCWPPCLAAPPSTARRWAGTCHGESSARARTCCLRRTRGSTSSARTARSRAPTRHSASDGPRDKPRHQQPRP